MLARLQRAIVFGLIAFAAAWAWYFARRGSFALASGGALLILVCQAPVLALEFVLQARVNRDDPAPKASFGQQLAAWWGEVLAGVRVFGWRQPFRSQRWPDRLPAPGSPPAERRGVLLVHGYVCNRGFWNPWLQRLHAEGVACVAVDLEPVFASIDDYAATLDAAASRLAGATGRPVVVVAHSMGGLAVRAWLDAHAGASAHVHRVVTIGSPHQGTFLAKFSFARSSVQMRLGSEWHSGLARRERHAGRFAFDRFTCFYGHCDNIVFPASTATLPGADNRHIAGRAHVQMAFQPEVFNEVWRWLPVDDTAGPRASAPAR